MTLSEGSQGDSGHDDHRVKRLVKESVESTAFRAASKIAIIIVVPLLGVVVTNVISDFKESLAELKKVQAEQTELINEKLDATAIQLRGIVKDTKDRDHKIELQLNTIEEILRNRLKSEENRLDELEKPPFKRDLGMRKRTDGIAYPRFNVHTSP